MRISYSNYGYIMIKKIIEIIGAGIMSLVILSVFCFFYQNDGINIANPNHATDYTNIPNSIKATLTEGFCFFRMDEHGYNNQTVRDEIDILLMGSSHVESAHVQPEYTISSLLNEQLVDFYTYNIGIPGHTIYRCADNLKNAVQIYQPKQYVVIETSAVQLDMGQMLSVLNGTASPIKTHDTGILYYFQMIPALKVLFNQLSLWRDADINSTEKVNGNEVGHEDYDKVLNMFLAKMRGDTPNGCKLIIFYHPTAKVSNGDYEYARDPEYRVAFQSAAEQNDIIFLDMTEVFQRYYEDNSCLTHGFVNTAVEKGHINSHGNQLVADELVSVIRGDKK